MIEFLISFVSTFTNNQTNTGNQNYEVSRVEGVHEEKNNFVLI